MQLRTLLILGILLLLIVLFAIRGRHKSSSGIISTTASMNFTMNDLNGQPVQLSSYRGKVVVVDVWATWCGYCVAEIPDLIAAQEQADQSKSPLQFIGIAMDDHIADVQSFAAQRHFSYPILYQNRAQMQSFGTLEGYPTKFIIDKNGRIVDKIVGAVPMATLSQRIAPYLK